MFKYIKHRGLLKETYKIVDLITAEIQILYLFRKYSLTFLQKSSFQKIHFYQIFKPRASDIKLIKLHAAGLMYYKTHYCYH